MSMSHVNTHTRAHMCTHAHARAHAYTHTHARTPNNTNLPFLFLTDIPPCWGHTVLYVGRSVTVHGDPSVITVPLSAQAWIQLAAPRGFWLGTSQEVAIGGRPGPLGMEEPLPRGLTHRAATLVTWEAPFSARASTRPLECPEAMAAGGARRPGKATVSFGTEPQRHALASPQRPLGYADQPASSRGGGTG